MGHLPQSTHVGLGVSRRSLPPFPPPPPRWWSWRTSVMQWRSERQRSVSWRRRSTRRSCRLWRRPTNSSRCIHTNPSLLNSPFPGLHHGFCHLQHTSSLLHTFSTASGKVGLEPSFKHRLSIYLSLSHTYMPFGGFPCYYPSFKSRLSISISICSFAQNKFQNIRPGFIYLRLLMTIPLLCDVGCFHCRHNLRESYPHQRNSILETIKLQPSSLMVLWSYTPPSQHWYWLQTLFNRDILYAL